MIIIREKQTVKEGVWSIPPAGQELAMTKKYIAKVVALTKEMYGVFGDDELFDDFGNVNYRIARLGVEAFIQNSAKQINPKKVVMSLQDAMPKAIAIVDQAWKVFSSDLILKSGMDKEEAKELALCCLGNKNWRSS